MKHLHILLVGFIMLCALCGCTEAAPPEHTSGSSTTETPAQTEHSHRFGKWEVLQPATCETDGISLRTCACGQTQEQPIVASGHKWSKVTCTTASSCTECGVAGEDALGHDLVDGVCTRCNESFRTQEDVQNILKIVHAQIYQIDSAGGVSVDIGWENTSAKTISYIYFEVGAYNAVGDPVRCQVRKEYNRDLCHTGPYLPGEKNYSVNQQGMYKKCDYVWDNVWYNDTAETIRIFQVRITYTDGSEILLNEAEAAMAMSDMTLSTNVTKVELDTISYTMYARDGKLPVKFALICDEGYQIRKYGTVRVRLRKAESAGLLDWTYGEVLHEATYTLTDDNYITSFSNEATIPVMTGLTQTGRITFELELLITFEDSQETITYRAICMANVL